METNVKSIWNGYDCEEFFFEDHKAVVVFPKEGTENGSIVMKMVYWGAFPKTEIELLEKGFHLCYVDRDNRWGTDPDLDRKARFFRFVQNRYQLNGQCVAVGMSCGGLFAIKLAAKYPELIRCIYLDAPVVNYMSCPCGFGVGNPLAETNEEILKALGMKSISELLSYREMPLDKLEELVKHRIPVIMVAGDSDSTVPYCENGALLERAYRNAGIDIEVYIKPDCGHHPHGLEDPTPVVEFMLRRCN